MSSKEEPKISKWASFKKYARNSETGECFGRTPASWLKILIFYVIFYLCLAGFWTAMLVVFYQTLNEKVPSLTQDDGLITGSPGMGFRPSPKEASSSLIWYRVNSSKDYNEWANRTYTWLSEHYSNKTPDTDDCGAVSENKPCFFDAYNIELPCRYETNYGFSSGTPCIIIKLNRVYGWEPVPYKDNEIPEKIKDVYKKDEVLVTCEGAEAADRDNLGKVNYYPRQGFPNVFYPFKSQEHYMSPLVFLHLAEPKRHVLITINCRAWAANIKYDSKHVLGSTHFELLID